MYFVGLFHINIFSPQSGIIYYHNSFCSVLNSDFFLSFSFSPGVYFTNNLGAAFAHSDPKSAKRLSRHHCLFALLGSLCKKLAAHKMLVILTSDAELAFAAADPFLISFIRVISRHFFRSKFATKINIALL